MHPKPGTGAFGRRAAKRKERIESGKAYAKSGGPAPGTSQRGRHAYEDAQKVQHRLEVERSAGLRRGGK